MGDVRRYTGTQTLQICWTAVAVIAIAGLAVVVAPSAGLPLPAILVGGSVAWMVGLVLLGLRERRHWNVMVERSSFDHDRGTSSADLERLVGGRSVTVTTDVSEFFFGTHTEIRTAVEDVDASFTVRFSYAGAGAEGEGITTGNDTLDERFVIEGSEQNAARLLSTEVQAALMEVETPGTCTVTGNEVRYEVPFTRLSAAELETIGDLVVTITKRVEAVGRGSN